MKTPKKYRDLLANEIGSIRNRIKEEDDPRRKVFFYSGIYAMLHRIYNIEYDPHLQFIHFVINVTYNAIIQRLSLIASGDVTVPFPRDFFDKLDRLLERLQNNIENGENTYAVLEKISNLTFLLNGNGYYLSTKGVNVLSE